MLKVNALANLGIIQAVLRKIDTFDIIDGEWIKINICCTSGGGISFDPTTQTYT